jgi:MinD-like ATPase involved in chromosome partitioning or flagellar assembly
MNFEISLPGLRKAITEALSPKRLLLRRVREGALDLRVLSDRFSEIDDPLSLLKLELKNRGLSLPDRTLTFLKSPDELEEGEEEILFSQPLLNTPTWADALALESEAAPVDDRGFPTGIKVVAFWGLKGGVGRSTALSHVALLLGRRQIRVLAIDLDLESPALVGALSGETLRPDHIRFEELVRVAEDPATSDGTLKRMVERALTPSLESGALVEILGPVQADASFVRALLGPLSPSLMYRGRQSALRRLIREAVEISGAQIILLDARSGYCDESAMAVLDLADEVVLFASPSPSTYPSFAPAVEALERNRRARGRPGVVHVVAGMTPAGEQARQRILENLQSDLEEARAQVNEALATPQEELAPDIVVTPLDYSARIVENDGGLRVSGVTEGYRDLAERISPPPLPQSVVETQAGWTENVLREARVPDPQAESESNPKLLADLFTRTPDLERFLRHDNFLVRGAKGTGKSYLRRICLENQHLLGERHGAQKTIFVDGYSAPRAGRENKPPVNQDLLRRLDQKHPERWAEIWSVLSLGRVLTKLDESGVKWQPGNLTRAQGAALGTLAQATKLQQVENEVAKLLRGRNALVLSDAWRELDEWLQDKGRTVTLLFDDLDVALGETDKALERRRAMIIGLLDQANAAWFAGRNLGVKVFLRSDVFNGLGAEEQAKYRDRGFELVWRADDIWRLVIRAMVVASTRFKEHLETRGIASERLEEIPPDDWEHALELIWGERMGGSGESNTRTTTWAEKRLRDGGGRLFPRAALWLVGRAVDARKSARAERPPLLDARALRDAMPTVAERRLDELLAECGVHQKERVLRLKGFKAYQDKSDFIEALTKSGESDPESALKELEDLGVIEFGSRREKSRATARIVDLYAFAPRLEIQRLGRR